MFADLRDYTVWSKSWPHERLAALLSSDECAAAIWKYDGLLNKTGGDSVFAIFNFPVRQADHPTQALLAAREIMHRRLTAKVVSRR